MSISRKSNGLRWMIAALLMLGGGTYAQTPAEVDELKSMLKQTQESMQQMMDQHQRQIDLLQQRIEELESRTDSTEASTEFIENTLIGQQVESTDSIASSDQNVTLHGYYDFLFLDATDSTSRSFILNELALFLRGRSEDERWTFFSELEFELLEGDDFYFVDDDRSSEFEIETAWLEYSVSDLLQVRAGKHLLPQYWQTYHYPNLTLSTRPPAMVGRIFPDSVTGIQFRGTDWWESQRGFSYVAYVGNGGDPEEDEVDANDDKAVGGRLTAHLAGDDSRFDTLDFSVSGYSGDDNEGRNEHVLGLDAQVRLDRWEFLTEWAWGDQYVDVPTGATSTLEESDALGYYAQLGYRFHPNWHAFYRYDELDLYDAGTTPFDSHQNTIGLNFRPLPNISLKLELFEANIDRINDSLHGIATAIVYNF